MYHGVIFMYPGLHITEELTRALSQHSENLFTEIVSTESLSSCFYHEGTQVIYCNLLPVLKFSFM